MIVDRNAMMLFAMGVVLDSEEQERFVNAIESDPGLMFDFAELLEDPTNPPKAVVDALRKFSTEEFGELPKLHQMPERSIVGLPRVELSNVGRVAGCNFGAELAAAPEDGAIYSPNDFELLKCNKFLEFTVDLSRFENLAHSQVPTIVYLTIGEVTRKVKGEVVSERRGQSVIKGTVCCNYFGKEAFTEKDLVSAAVEQIKE